MLGVNIVKVTYLFICQERKEITVVVNSSISNLILVLETGRYSAWVRDRMNKDSAILLCSLASWLTITAV